MFKIHLSCAILVWILLVLGGIFAFSFPSKKAKKDYHRLMNYNTQIKEEELSHENPAQQLRYQVSKQILFKKEHNRSQSRLASDNARLVFQTKDKKNEFVEHFENLTCIMQDKSEESGDQTKQDFKVLKAIEAVYAYKNGQLEATNVDIVHYSLPAGPWPLSFDADSPLLQGHAHKVDLSLFEESVFKAKEFEAVLHNQVEE